MATSPTDARSIILSVINQLEGTTIGVNDVNFGIPQRATGSLPVRNTKIVISPKTESGYYGNKTLWYNRIHVSELGAISVQKDTATTQWDLIPAINQKYGIFLTTDDILDSALPVNQSGLITINLTINQSSLMFYGGPIIATPGFIPGITTTALVPAMWDDNYKAASIDIDLTGYEVSADPGIGMVRSNTSFTFGKRYFEFTNASENGLVGFGTGEATTNVLLGSDSETWALDTYTGLFTHNNLTVLDLSSQLASLGNNPVGFMLDLDFNTLTLILVGDVRVEVPGVNMPDEFMFAMVGNKSAVDPVTNIVANFGNDTFVYSVPVSYYPGFGTGGSPIMAVSGTLVSQSCNGFDLIGVYTDGAGGTYTALIEGNSGLCGYIATTPPPTTTAAPTTTGAPTTTNVPTTTSAPTTTGSPTTTVAPTTTSVPTTTIPPTTTTAPTTTSAPTTTAAPTTPPPTTTSGPTTTAPPTTMASATNGVVTLASNYRDSIEGVTEVMVYSIVPPINTDTLLEASISHITTTSADLGPLQFSIGESNIWTDVPGDNRFTVTQSNTTFKLRVKILIDGDDDADESFNVLLSAQAGSTNITIDSQAASMEIYVMNTPYLITPTWMDLFRASTTIDRTTPRNAVEVTTTDQAGIFSRNIIGEGNNQTGDGCYFEVTFTGTLTPGVTNLYVGAATANFNPSTDIASNGVGIEAALLSVTDGFVVDCYGSNAVAGYYGALPDSTTVFGFSYSINNKNLIIRRDGTNVGDATINFGNSTPEIREAYIFVSCNDPSITVNVNTGQSPFIHQAEVYIARGMGKIVHYLDDYENNNRLFPNMYGISSIYNIQTSGALAGTMTGGYNKPGGYLNIEYAGETGHVNLLRLTETQFKDIRLTVDFEYQDGADLGGGTYTPSFFSLVSYRQGNAGVSTICDIYNRTAAGGQEIKSGYGFHSLPRTRLNEDGTRGLGVATVTMPNSGRHTLMYEIVSQRITDPATLIGGKVHSLYIDGVLIRSQLDDGTSPDINMGVYLDLGNCGDNKIYSYKVEDLTPDEFITYQHVYGDPGWNSTALSNGLKTANIALDPDELTFTVSGNGTIGMAEQSLYFGKYYWEFEFQTDILDTSGILIGVGNVNMLSTSGTGSTETSVLNFGNIPAISLGDIVGVLFDANNGRLEILVNNVSHFVQLCSDLGTAQTSYWMPFFRDEAYGGVPYTVKAVFDELNMAHTSQPAGYNLGIKIR